MRNISILRQGMCMSNPRNYVSLQRVTFSIKTIYSAIFPFSFINITFIAMAGHRQVLTQRALCVDIKAIVDPSLAELLFFIKKALARGM